MARKSEPPNGDSTVKNEIILSAGCTTHEIGLVLSGSVNIENIDLWGSKSILSNISSGQVFGETYAFCRETLMVDTVAAEDTGILFWNLDILVHTPHPASTWQPKSLHFFQNVSGAYRPETAFLCIRIPLCQGTGQYTVYVYVYVPSSFFTVESPLGGSLFIAL